MTSKFKQKLSLDTIIEPMSKTTGPNKATQYWKLPKFTPYETEPVNICLTNKDGIFVRRSEHD